MVRASKSPTAFRTISEVANELDLPQHVLRFWETKFNQIRPLKRGGGRRYYRPKDIALLRQIRSLLYDDGYTIKGAQKYLKEGGDKADGHHGREAVEPPADTQGSTSDQELRVVLRELQDIQGILGTPV